MIVKFMEKLQILPQNHQAYSLDQLLNLLGEHLTTEKGKRDAIMIISAASFKDMYTSSKIQSRNPDENN